MSNITFQNEFEEEITVEQAEQMSDFIKVISSDNLIKLKESYKKNQLDSIVYYLDPTESESQGVARILQLYSPPVYFEIRSVQLSGVYRIEESRCYSNTGTYDDFQTTKLFDNQNRLIYEKQSSIENGNVEDDIEKYYYLGNGSEYLICKYDSITGSLIGISGGEPPFVPENDHFITIEEFPIYFPDFLTNNPYYNNADMMP